MRTAMPGSRIEDLRERADLHATDLSAALGISRRTLYKWETDAWPRTYHGAALAVLEWLARLPDRKLLAVVRNLRSRLATSAVMAQVGLYLEFVRDTAPRTLADLDALSADDAVRRDAVAAARKEKPAVVRAVAEKRRARA